MVSRFKGDPPLVVVWREYLGTEKGKPSENADSRETVNFLVERSGERGREGGVGAHLPSPAGRSRSIGG